MGELTKGGETRPVTQDEWALNEEAQVSQDMQEVPVLQRTGNPHEYLFFALFDGTGQDADDPEQTRTNIGHLYLQSKTLSSDPGNRIGYKYIEGIGTQANPVARYADAWIPYTWDDKIEDAYRALANQAKQWREQDSEAQIRIAAVGYSRGAVLSAGLARLVDQYGIADPEELRFGRDARGNLTVESTRPLLAAPGEVAQAMGLFDPVATNLPDNYDARPAPSVISALAMAAAHERRESFPHQAILAPGLSADHRFVNVLMPGGHSNVGGGNHDPGLETQAFNQMVRYLNGLRDKPLFEDRPLPDEPALYTVYQTHGPSAVPGLDPDGLRNLRPVLANCKIVDPCRYADSMNQTLADQFDYRRLQPAAPVPALPQLQQEAAQAVPARPAPSSLTWNESAGITPHQPATATPQIGTPQPGLQPFSHPNHPQHALYADVRQRFGAKDIELSEAQLSDLTRQMHGTGYAPGWQGDVTVYNDKAVVGSFQIGSRMASVDLSTPAPSVQDTMKDFQAEQHDRAQSMERLHQQQQATSQAHGHALGR